MVSANYIDSRELRQWQEIFEGLDENNEPPIYFVPFFSAIGRRRG